MNTLKYLVNQKQRQMLSMLILMLLITLLSACSKHLLIEQAEIPQLPSSARERDRATERVYTELLGRLSERDRIVSEYADRLAAVGLSCERYYMIYSPRAL